MPMSSAGNPIASGYRSQPGSDTKTGIIKWFDSVKGYGFIASLTERDDVFLHATALESAGIHGSKKLEGQRVSFTVAQQRGRQCATNVKLLADV